MRVVRTILGILLITVGLPLVLAGAGLWTAMQHRDAGGAFSGDVEAIRTSGYAVVVPDVDALLRRQAPFARSEGTHLRVAAQAGGRPAFVGLAPAADAARYLAGTEHTRLTEVRLARGELPVRGSTVRGAAGPPGAPGNQRFWAGSGVGALDWSPAEVGDRSMSLVIMAADGQRPGTVTATAELRPGWLNSSAWGLLILGSLLLLLGIGALAWPSRTREIVYVVDPAQVPDIAARLGVPVPDLTGAARLRPRGSDPGSGGAGPGTPAAIPSSRPATLAETAQPQPQPAASVAVGPASVAPVPPVAGGAEPAPPAAAWSASPPASALPTLAWPPIASSPLASSLLPSPPIASSPLASPPRTGPAHAAGVPAPRDEAPADAGPSGDATAAAVPVAGGPAVEPRPDDAEVEPARSGPGRADLADVEPARSGASRSAEAGPGAPADPAEADLAVPDTAVPDATAPEVAAAAGADPANGERLLLPQQQQTFTVGGAEPQPDGGPVDRPPFTSGPGSAPVRSALGAERENAGVGGVVPPTVVPAGASRRRKAAAAARLAAQVQASAEAARRRSAPAARGAADQAGSAATTSPAAGGAAPAEAGPGPERSLPAGSESAGPAPAPAARSGSAAAAPPVEAEPGVAEAAGAVPVVAGPGEVAEALAAPGSTPASPVEESGGAGSEQDGPAAAAGAPGARRPPRTRPNGKQKRQGPAGADQSVA